jgi:hypothetical protein
VRHEDAQRGVEREDAAQGAYRLGLVKVRVPVPGAVDPAVEQHVAPVRQPAERVAVVCDRGAGQRRRHGVEHRVGRAGVAPLRGGVQAGDAGVVGAEDAALVAQQLLREDPGVDAAGLLLDELGVEAGELGHPRDEPFDRRGVLHAAQQVADVFAGGVGLDLLQPFGGEGVLALHGGGGQRREKRHPRQGRVVGLAPPAEVEHGRDQRHAAQADAVLALEPLGDQRAAEAAVALAGEKGGRGGAAVRRQPAGDEVRQRLRVAVHRKVARAQLVGGLHEPAEAGPHGIDEDEVGEVEPGFGVGDEIRRLGGRNLALERQPPGAEPAELEKGRGRPWAAVDNEGDGARGARVLQRVGREGDVRLGLVLRVGERDGAGGRREAQAAVAEVQFVGRGPRGGKALGRDARRLRGVGGWLLRLGREGGRARAGAPEGRRGRGKGGRAWCGSGRWVAPTLGEPAREGE